MEETAAIRSARLDDAPALAGLFTELGFPASSAEMAKRLEAMPQAESALVAERNGDVLGVVTVHVTPVLHRPTPVGRLTALVVTEQARGQGIGRMLVAAAEKLLARQGCRLVEVTSNQQLTGAHEFYRRLGFEATSLRFKKVLP
jgi:ribosomal protein S18 acetylase RimI-like enzyme